MLFLLTHFPRNLLYLTTAVPILVSGKVTIEVVPSHQYQQFDGLGISEAFQRARQIYGSDGLSPENTEVVLNALFSNRTGAGLTILRNGIGSSVPGAGYDFMSSIAPFPPGSLRDGPVGTVVPGSPGGTSWNGTNTTVISPAADSIVPHDPRGPGKAPSFLYSSVPISSWSSIPPRYSWDADDNGQVRLAKDALARGVRTIYADAWSAPAWMKSNLQDSGGGSLCGVDGVSQCRQGDMRTAYAEYLTQYVTFWEGEGVKVGVLGSVNEGDFNTSYTSMLSTGGQTASFLKVLHAKLRAANLTVLPQLACCDASGWEQSREQILGIKNAGAEDLLDIVTSHGYTTPPSTPLPTTHRVWQSEWADLEGPPTLAWWFNHSAGEGLVWALRIQDAFVHANVSAFLGWIGAGNTSSNSALILLNKNEARVSKRLWAFAQFSRFVRPGARRIEARILPTPSTPRALFDGTEGGIHVSAFQNPDSGIAVQVINNSTLDECVQIYGVSTRGKILRRWLTNEDHDLSKMSVDTHRAGRGGEECVGDVVGPLPAKSMVSFVVDTLRPFPAGGISGGSVGGNGGLLPPPPGNPLGDLVPPPLPASLSSLLGPMTSFSPSVGSDGSSSSSSSSSSLSYSLSSSPLTQSSSGPSSSKTASVVPATSTTSAVSPFLSDNPPPSSSSNSELSLLGPPVSSLAQAPQQPVIFPSSYEVTLTSARPSSFTTIASTPSSGP